jgi:peptidoglycan-N-acetylglucosamine deacetylase
VRRPSTTAHVPPAIRDGGPVVGTRAGPVDARRLPPRTVILTFDDGPDPTWTPRILDVLRRHRVPGSFFLLGNQVLQHPGVVRRMLAEGHEVGNHSFDHPDLAVLSPREQRRQLAQAQLALVGATGVTTSLMRPPYSFSTGSLDDPSWDVVRAAHEDGYVTVLADVDSRDWERPGVDAVVRDATPPDGRGAIVLLHDAGGDRSQTVAALDRLIPRLRAAGDRFTTVGDAFNLDPYDAAAPAELWRGRAFLWATQAAG